MFTIKHIDKHNTEHLIEAETVWYTDNSEETVNTGEPMIWELSYTTGPLVLGGRLTRTINFGTVYVMNANGKTVANYDLGDPE
jgi:hypothetical protein